MPRKHAARPLTARQACLQVLHQWRQEHANARDSLNALVATGRLERSQLGTATELTMGVLRHRLTIARLVGAFTDRGWRAIRPELQDVLALGAYQLIWLDGVPAFAAVNESVTLAKQVGGQPAGRFVNAVLRNMQRSIQQHRTTTANADTSRSVLINPERCCELDRPIMPNPASEPVAYWSAATSHPAELVSRWIGSFGTEAMQQICLSGICRPSVWLRPNPMRTDANSLAEQCRQEGFEASVGQDGRQVVLHHATAVSESTAFRSGWCQPQDPTAFKTVLQMQLQPGQQIVDLCAAPGTKSTQMAEIMRNQGRILACDRDVKRLQMIERNAQRLGITIIQTLPVEQAETAVAHWPQVDWILVDAPCSNTGVLARRPEARYRVNSQAVRELAAIQSSILDLAARIARGNTRICYSTCSLEGEENEQVCQNFLQRHPQWRLTAQHRTFPAATGDPAQWHDGGFYAILQPKTV